LLAGAGCNFVFAPDEAEFYPEAQIYEVMPPAALADILKGEFRPGFFTTVCTVVLKLLQWVQPAVAVFGQKDHQQLKVIAAMARQFALPVEVVSAPTVRADDGLALSSRNGYLDEAEPVEAVALRKALSALADRARDAGATLAALEREAVDALTMRGWLPESLTVRRRSDLLRPTEEQRPDIEPLVALGGLHAGRTAITVVSPRAPRGASTAAYRSARVGLSGVSGSSKRACGSGWRAATMRCT